MKLIPIEGRGNEFLFKPEGKNTIWVSRFKKGFGRKQQSLRTENNIEARQRRDELFAQWLGEKPKFHKSITRYSGDLWDEWAKTKTRKSQATQDSIKFSGQHLKPFINDLYPQQINEIWWENTYIPNKREQTHKDRKFFNDWKWITTFLKHLHREGHIERLPRITNPDPPRAEGLFLSDSEIEALYANVNENLEVQIDLGFKHFMRRSEVLLLSWSEIDSKRSLIKLPAERTKVRKSREIPVNKETLEKLMARKKLSESPYVFPSPMDPNQSITRTGNDTAWKNAIARANKEDEIINPEATFHDLRHSGLTRAFAATNRYVEICVMAGLSLEEAQKTYLHLKPDHTRFVADLVTVNKSVLNGNDKQ